MRPLMLAGALLALTSCVPALQTPGIPLGMKPIPTGDVSLWARGTMPRKWVMLRFGFRERNLVDASSQTGRGYAFIAPPDSLHLDFHLLFGMMSGAASVLGDSALWAEPKEEVKKLVPSYHLLWAIAGIARPPAAGWTAESFMDPKTITVRYTRGADTVLYTSQRTRLVTYVVEGGRPIGRVWTEFDALRQVVSSRLLVLSSPFQVDVTFDSVDPKKQVHIERETWNAPTTDH